MRELILFVAAGEAIDSCDGGEVATVGVLLLIAAFIAGLIMTGRGDDE